MTNANFRRQPHPLQPPPGIATCWIELDTPPSVRQFCQCFDLQLHGRQILLREDRDDFELALDGGGRSKQRNGPHRRPHAEPDSNTIFVNNLPWASTEEVKPPQLRDATSSRVPAVHIEAFA